MTRHDTQTDLPHRTLTLGVDIGGSKVAAGLVDPDGTVHHQVRAPMVSHGDAAAGLAAVNSAIAAVLRNVPGNGNHARVRAIGICSPGPLDPHAGVIINPPNLPCWRNFPLAAEVLQAHRIPVKLDNDANAAALAEALWGAGRGYRNIFYTCIGTGIGTGIVFDGRIYHGRTGAGAEGGHMSIDYRGPVCGCGKPGCIESLASGPAIARIARERMERDPARASGLLELAEGKLGLVNSEMVGKAYAAGDPLAREILADVISYLSLWLGNIVDLLEPDVIILGGGVALMLEPLLPDIRDRLPRCSVNTRCQEIPLLAASYGVDAGIAGGAALCSAETRG
jgi:glucokinase